MSNTFFKSYFSIYEREDLSLADKAVYCLIANLDNGEDHCHASREYMADKIKVSVRTIANSLSALSNAGLITISHGRNKRLTIICHEINDSSDSDCESPSSEVQKCKNDTSDIKSAKPAHSKVQNLHNPIYNINTNDKHDYEKKSKKYEYNVKGKPQPKSNIQGKPNRLSQSAPQRYTLYDATKQGIDGLFGEHRHTDRLLDLVRYFTEKYAEYRGEVHPDCINPPNVLRWLKFIENVDDFQLYDMVDKYFQTDLACDYHFHHFMSTGVFQNRYSEVTGERLWYNNDKVIRRENADWWQAPRQIATNY